MIYGETWSDVLKENAQKQQARVWPDKTCITTNTHRGINILWMKKNKTARAILYNMLMKFEITNHKIIVNSYGIFLKLYKRLQNIIFQSFCVLCIFSVISSVSGPFWRELYGSPIPPWKKYKKDNCDILSHNSDFVS